MQLSLVFCQDFQQSLLLTQNTLKTAAKPTSRQKQFLSGRVIYRNRLADKNKNVNPSFAFLSGFHSAFDQCLIPPTMGIRVVGNPINLTASIWAVPNNVGGGLDVCVLTTPPQTPHSPKFTIFQFENIRYLGAVIRMYRWI